MLQLLCWLTLFISALEGATTTTTTRHPSKAPTTLPPTTLPPTRIPTHSPTKQPTPQPTLQPTVLTGAPTHRPTVIPSASPTWAPTILLEKNEDVEVTVNVTLVGSEVMSLCTDTNLDKYKGSLENVFVAASGVSTDDLVSTKIISCNKISSGSILLHELRSSNARTKYSVAQRINNEIFISQYQSNLDLVFSSVLVTNAKLVEAEAVPSEKSKRHPFAHFFSPYFGLGVVILVVSALWCLLLRAEDGETDGKRLQQLQEEKRKFELKYGLIEEDSLDRTEKDILESVEMADNTKGTTETQGETKVSGAGVQTQTQTQTQAQAQAQTQTRVEVQTQAQSQPQGEAQAQTQPQTQNPNAEATNNTTAQSVYRASVVDEVKHVKNAEERESLDLDQIKDPGKKRRKTQEYLNNLWDDKTNQKEPAKAQDNEEEEEEDDEE